LALADDIAVLLIDIEAQLRQLDLWEDTSPAPEALASREPFAVDMLSFSQWLQFIFLPTLYGLLAEQQDLPTECAVAPMAQEYFRSLKLPSRALEASLLAVDQLLSDR
jgi:uncharacterized protein YqcC (DUF446 family)